MNPGKNEAHFTSFEQRHENPHYEGVVDIEPQELLQKMAQVQIIDVRQPSEFSAELGHIASAKLIVLDTLPDQFQHLPKDKTVVFVCRSGGRSARATAFAQLNGLKNAYNMRGGMLLWNELGLPTEK